MVGIVARGGSIIAESGERPRGTRSVPPGLALAELAAVASATGCITRCHRLRKETRMWFRRQSACLALLGLLLASVASAQVTTADIVGRVTDASGAVLPGAT